MKRKSVSILNNVVDKLDATQNIDKTDTLVGKHVVIDAADLSQSVDDIKAVITTLKQEIEFDDALKGVNNTCGNPSGCDDECRKNKHCPNPDECTQPLQCHIHSWEHLEFDEDCHLCVI